MASILLVDDDETLRSMTAALLMSGGHKVDTADDGKSGLALYKSKLHDLVITDIVMAEMDGLKLIEELRHANPRPRVIAMSGGHQLSEPILLPTAKLLGAERILAKPIMPDVFLRTVADVLAESAQAPVRQNIAGDGSTARNPSKS
jgi:CheY-like chemotaxis protein